MFKLMEENELATGRNPPTTVYLVTYAEPDSGDPNRLSERGRSHMSELLKSRVMSDVKHVYSGTAKVMLHSAGIISRHFNSQVSVIDCLNDINLGKTQEEELWVRVWSDFTFSPHGGESMNNFIDRIVGCTIKIIRKHSYDNIVLMTSPLASAAIYHFVTGIEFNPEIWLEIGIPSCACYDFTITQWELVMPPDNTFLTEHIFMQDLLSEQLVDKLRKIEHF